MLPVLEVNSKSLENDAVENNYDVMGYFYKSNIHPYTECLKRQKTLEAYADQIEMKVIYKDGYEIEGFLQKIIFYLCLRFIDLWTVLFQL